MRAGSVRQENGGQENGVQGNGGQGNGGRRCRAVASRLLHLRLLEAAVCLAIACGSVATAAAAPAPAVPSLFVVSASPRGSSANLFAVNPGRALRRLTTSKAEQTDPALSPDGSEVAYVQAASPNCLSCPSTIWVANADGSNAHALTHSQQGVVDYDQNPSWSPDGTQIVFSRSTVSSYELYTVAASGGTPHDLFVPGVSPAWGPTRIAYVAPPPESAGPGALWTISPDGTDPTKITTSYIVSPTWSSKGALAYLDQAPEAKPILVVLTGSASHQYQLPFAEASSLSWSPDDRELAIVARSSATAPADVYTITDAGKTLARLTTNIGALGATVGD